MLQEIPPERVRELKGEDRCRWFRDDYFDLFVWFGESDDIISFQLHYDIYRNPRALFWDTKRGASHHRVDDGENRPGKPKGTPMVMAGGRFDQTTVTEQFRNRNQSLDPHVSDFIIGIIRNHPSIPVP